MILVACRSRSLYLPCKHCAICCQHLALSSLFFPPTPRSSSWILSSRQSFKPAQERHLRVVQGVSSWLRLVKPRPLRLLEELMRSVIPTCSLPYGVILHTFHFLSRPKEIRWSSLRQCTCSVVGYMDCPFSTVSLLLSPLTLRIVVLTLSCGRHQEVMA